MIKLILVSYILFVCSSSYISTLCKQNETLKQTVLVTKTIFSFSNLCFIFSKVDYLIQVMMYKHFNLKRSYFLIFVLYWFLLKTYWNLVHQFHQFHQHHYAHQKNNVNNQQNKQINLYMKINNKIFLFHSVVYYVFVFCFVLMFSKSFRPYDNNLMSCNYKSNKIRL
jgi:hypothetical protein